MKQHWRLPSRCTPPRCLYAAGTVPATPTQTPHPFPTYSPPSRAADSPPHTSTAPLHTAPIPPDSATRPALALPTLVPCRTLHHPSLQNRHTFDAYSTRILFAQYHPTDASPALYAARPLAQWANADRSRSDRSCPRHSPSPALPVSPPLVCISQALHREAASYYARHVRDYAVLPRVDIRCHPISCTEIKLHAHVNSPKMWFQRRCNDARNGSFFKNEPKSQHLAMWETGS